MSVNKVFVYIANIPEKVDFCDLVPSERDQEVKNMKSFFVKKQKFFVWKLLEKALWEIYGLRVEELSAYKSESGKWLSSRCSFSLSHSGNAVAVAISDESIGIDIEEMKARASLRLLDAVFNEDELALYRSLDSSSKFRLLIERWTKKESVYKLNPLRYLSPINADLSDSFIYTDFISLNEKEYVFSVASAQDFEIHLKLMQ